MKQQIKIIRRVDKVKEEIEKLKAEQDYELASLHHAKLEGDSKEIERSTKRLHEIHDELIYYHKGEY